MREIAIHSENDTVFNSNCQLRVKEYLKEVESFKNEIEKLKVSIVYKSILGGALLDGTVRFVLSSGMDLDAMTTIGLHITKAITDHASPITDILNKRKNMKKTNGFALYNHYKYLV